MKKLFLSISLTILFAGYVAYQRLVGFGKEFTYVVPVPGTGAPAPVPSLEPPPVPPAVETPPPPPITIPITPAPPPVPPTNTGRYRNGSYVGDVTDAYYGNVQVQAIIANGKISDVQFLDYPQDRGNSIRINRYAMPILISEAINAQSANVDGVSGATATSGAFNESLASALAQAAN